MTGTTFVLINSIFIVVVFITFSVFFWFRAADYAIPVIFRAHENIVVVYKI